MGWGGVLSSRRSWRWLRRWPWQCCPGWQCSPWLTCNSHQYHSLSPPASWARERRRCQYLWGQGGEPHRATVPLHGTVYGLLSLFPHRNNRKLGQDDSPSDGSGYLLRAFNSKINMAIVPSDDKSLEPGLLPSLPKLASVVA